MDLLIAVLTLLTLCSDVFSKCQWPTHVGNPAALKKLQPLMNKTFSTLDNTGYSYTIGICKASEEGEKYATAGVVQTKISKPSEKIIIGSLNNARIMAGTEWILLEYQQGQNYQRHCEKSARQASIMITCDPNKPQGDVRIIEENTNKTKGCYYLFEIDHAAICPNGSYLFPGGLSIGSILVIILIIVCAIYFLVGFLYQRFVAGAKGWEQIPNYSFWQDFGALQADGCNFICRTSASTRNPPRLYKGIGDDQLQDDDDDRDDHLLPM